MVSRVAGIEIALRTSQLFKILEKSSFDLRDFQLAFLMQWLSALPSLDINWRQCENLVVDDYVDCCTRDFPVFLSKR